MIFVSRVSVIHQVRDQTQPSQGHHVRVGLLADYLKSQVRRGRGHQHLGAFEGDRRVQRAEQGRAATEQDRDHVHADLIDQAERECLLHDGRAVQADDLVARRTLGALNRALTTPSVTNVYTGGYDVPGSLWVSTKHGVSPTGWRLTILLVAGADRLPNARRL